MINVAKNKALSIKCFLIMAFLFVALLISGCDSANVNENISGKIRVVNDEVSKKLNDNLSNIIKNPVGKINSLHEELQNISNLSTKKLELIDKKIYFNKKYLLNKGSDLIGSINGKKAIVVVESINPDNIDIKINNKLYKGVKEGSKLEVNDATVVVDDIFYNSDEGKDGSLVLLIFKNEVLEHYPNILIEDEVGGFPYKESRLEGVSFKDYNLEDYIGVYEEGIKVHVLKGQKKALEGYFLYRWPATNKIQDLGKGLIYLNKQEDYLSWLSDGYLVWFQTSKNFDLDELLVILYRYLDKYPSKLDKDFNCKNDILIDEKDSKEISLGNINLNISVFIIEDKSNEATLIINGEYYYKLLKNDIIKAENINIFVKNIRIYSNTTKDNIELCIN